MDAPFEAKGFWWLPETPENEISGNLSFSPGQPIHLELMGALNQTKNDQIPPPEMINPPIIQGALSDGRLVTLQKCLQTQSSVNFGGISTTKFTCHLAFVGVHFDSEEQIKFSGVSLCFKFLDEWFSKNAFSSQRPDGGSLVVTYKRPSLIMTLVPGFHIDFECLGPSESSNWHSYVKIFQEARINIWSEFEKNLDEFFPILRLLQYFLTLAITEPTFVTKAIGKTNAAQEEEPDHIIYLPIEIYFPATGWRAETSDVNRFEMLFTLPAIEERLEIVLNNWVKKAEIIKPVYDLYFSAIYAHAYPEFEFLSLAQAIETYHRRIYGGEYQPDDEYSDGLYKTLIEAIPSELASDFRGSLIKGKLRYANEYSFRKRLLLLGDHLAKNMKVNFLSDKKQKGTFSEKVADTRNYFTHYSPELKQKAALGGEELLDLRRKLRLILQICFLEQLGFSFDTITGIFKGSGEYRQYIS
jgi:hypothetical protein